jgi:ATP-dependent RNA helicase DOB1
LRAELKKCEEKYQSMAIDDEESVGNYFRIRQQLDTLSQELRSYILKPVYLLPFLQPGRLLRVGQPALVVQL